MNNRNDMLTNVKTNGLEKQEQYTGYLSINPNTATPGFIYYYLSGAGNKKRDYAVFPWFDLHTTYRLPDQ